MVLSTFTVSNLLDSSPGSLRDQIAAASSGDTINFASGLSGTINLTSGELAIAKNLTIQGPGTATITVSGGGTQRVFHTPPSSQTPTGRHRPGARSARTDRCLFPLYCGPAGDFYASSSSHERTQ